MPTRRRRLTRLTLRAYISWLSSITLPTTRAPSIRSFIRLRTRMNVDLPHPEGPIRAVTDRSVMSSVMSKRACLAPYQNDSPETLNLAATPVRSGDLRPVMLRSEMIAEYDSVDTDAPRSGPTCGKALRCCDLSDAMCGFDEDEWKNPPPRASA